MNCLAKELEHLERQKEQRARRRGVVRKAEGIAFENSNGSNGVPNIPVNAGGDDLSRAETENEASPSSSASDFPVEGGMFSALDVFSHAKGGAAKSGGCSQSELRRLVKRETQRICQQKGRTNGHLSSSTGGSPVCIVVRQDPNAAADACSLCCSSVSHVDGHDADSVVEAAGLSTPQSNGVSEQQPLEVQARLEAMDRPAEVTLGVESAKLSYADMLKKKRHQPPESTGVVTDGDVGNHVTSKAASSVRVYPRLIPQPFSHIIVCDFEATCDSSSSGFPHEIIEFPALCIDTATLETVAVFHTYVQPTKFPQLTRFCTDLTGITQAQVGSAPTIVEVIAKFRSWLHDTVYPLVRARLKNGPPLSECLQRRQLNAFVYDDDLPVGRHTRLGPSNSGAPTRTDSLDKAAGGYRFTKESTKEIEKRVCFATDGPWDMKKFVVQCHVERDGIKFPPLFHRYINVRQCFSDFMKAKPIMLTIMLRKLGMSFVGRPHSGIDDTKNIARVLVALLSRGFRVNHVSLIACSGYSESKGHSGPLPDEMAELLLEECEKPRGGRSRHRQ